jgi:amino acid permease
MKKALIVFNVFAIVVIIGQLTVIDHNDLSWSNNVGSYLGIISMLILIIGIPIGNKIDKK